MFNTKEPFAGTLLSGSDKPYSCTFPTDQQWTDLAKKRKSVKRKTGRGLSDWEEPNREQAEYDLLQLLTDKGADFDKFEASKIIERLSRAEVLDVERNGSTFTVELKVFGCTVTHALGIPTMEDRFRYDREISKLTNGAQRIELYVNLPPCAEIWDRIKTGTSGYAEGSAVPIIHKAAALSAVLTHLQELENDDPEA